MRIKGNGNVGIGTTTPALLFHVAKNTNYNIGTSYGIAAANATNQNLRLNLGYDATLDAAVIQASQEGSTFNKKILLNPNAGNVGIGVTAPANLLEVGDRIRIRNGTSGTAGIYLNKNNNTTEAGFIGTYTDDNYVGIYGANGAGWNFFMSTINGNIGIGTAAPTEKLNVIGNGLFTGTVTAGSGVLVCSDIRYKTNILPISNALGSLLSLHGIYYNWDREKYPENGFTKERQMGFSAQEIEKVYPEMVKTDLRGYKTVDYSRLAPVLVEAIREQQKEIDELKAKVERLLEKID